MVSTGEWAQFPDSISSRACAHLAELVACTRAGHRAVLIFVVQRGDVSGLRINRSFDSVFTEGFDEAMRAGVEAIAVKHQITSRGFGPPTLIPVQG
jgi:sugar fermentation stimulation protein A